MSNSVPIQVKAGAGCLRAGDRVSDEASIQMLDKAAVDCVETCFARLDGQRNQCTFEQNSVCCRLCYLGPCRITPKALRGMCGADADTVVARNYVREVASGTAAHSDHGRYLVLLLKKVAEGRGGSYRIADEAALRRAARLYEIGEAGRAKEAVALDLADLFIAEFNRQEGALRTLKLAPVKRQGVWRQRGVLPSGIDRMVVESLHRTHVGVDHDYRNLLLHAFRTSLADGWGGSRAASIVSDILFGTPAPMRSRAGLGVLGERTVNIVVLGLEPALSEMLAIASRDPEIIAEARAAGAENLTLAGICCTANDILIRHGIPLVGDFLQQELAIITGAVEMFITGAQCCMPSLPEVAEAYHTEIVSTSDIAQTIGAAHVPFDEEWALDSAKALIRRAIANYGRRDATKMAVPKVSQPFVAGFSVAAIKHMLGGTYRASFRPLNDAIIQGRIKGIVGIVGCDNPRIETDSYVSALTRELIHRDVLVLETGCAASASAKAGMLTPEAASTLAGPGLREVCEAVGMPPVLHMGGGSDTPRLLEAATEVVLEGGLGDDLSEVPVAVVAPESMSEKAIAIGCCFVASGMPVILGHPFHIEGSDNVSRFLNEEVGDLFGASFHVCTEPQEAATLIMEIINQKREQLGINRKAERRLYDMRDRRTLNV